MSSNPALPPPFPDGSQVDTASLETIFFRRLVSKDHSEIVTLLKACETHGFFYLDLRDTDAAQLLEQEQELLKVTRKYFGQPLEIKLKDDQDSWVYGYKPVGHFSGAFENSRDGYESFKVTRGAMIKRAESLPSTVKDNIELFDRFTNLSHHVSQVILSCLSDILELNGPDRFEEKHRDQEPSNSIFALLYYPKNLGSTNIGQHKHTDIGSLTVLFANKWGLQVMTPENKSWTFVQPRPGYAIINVGDSLRFLSGKRLKSCVHRVIPLYKDEHRYSIGYFLRPERNVKLMDSEGRQVTAVEWEHDKHITYAKPYANHEGSTLLTGGMEKALRLE